MITLDCQNSVKNDKNDYFQLMERYLQIDTSYNISVFNAKIWLILDTMLVVDTRF